MHDVPVLIVPGHAASLATVRPFPSFIQAQEVFTGREDILQVLERECTGAGGWEGPAALGPGASPSFLATSSMAVSVASLRCAPW